MNALTSKAAAVSLYNYLASAQSLHLSAIGASAALLATTTVAASVLHGSYRPRYQRPLPPRYQRPLPPRYQCPLPRQLCSLALILQSRCRGIQNNCCNISTTCCCCTSNCSNNNGINSRGTVYWTTTTTTTRPHFYDPTTLLASVPLRELNA
jgi:hypothetical protein